MREAILKVFRGNQDGGEFKTYKVPVEEGMVVLDAIHYIQGYMEPELGVRWNCKAGRCGSCSAEVNGKPRLLCMTRMSKYEDGEPISVVSRRLCSASDWRFSSRTPGTQSASTIASITSIRLPSLKFGTISTSGPPAKPVIDQPTSAATSRVKASKPSSRSRSLPTRLSRRSRGSSSS